MTTTTDTTTDTPTTTQPVWAIPAALGILMLSGGGLFVLVAHGLDVLSSIAY